jgi:hypothetical protein
VEKAAVGAGADLVDDVWLEIGVDGAWHVLAIACVESVCDVGGADLSRGIPVSEKKVEKPWSSSAALRSSVR